MKGIGMTRFVSISMLVLVCMAPLAMSAQEDKAPERKAIKHENIEWKWVTYVKFHQGKRWMAQNIINKYYKKAAEMAGLPGPEMQLFMETGEWDYILVWNMEDGIEGMNWQRSPNNVAWRNALDEVAGGEEEAQAIIDEYQSYVMEQYGEVGYVNK